MYEKSPKRIREVMTTALEDADVIFCRVIIVQIARRHDRTRPRASRIPPLNSRQTLSSSRIPPLKRRDAPLLFSRARPRRKIDTFEDDYWCSFGASSTFNVAMPRAVVAVSAHRISVEVIVSRATFLKSASNDTGEFRRCRVVGFRRSVRCLVLQQTPREKYVTSKAVRDAVFFVVLLSNVKKEKRKKIGIGKSPRMEDDEKKPLSSSPRYDFAARRDTTTPRGKTSLAFACGFLLCFLLFHADAFNHRQSIVRRWRGISNDLVLERALQTSAGGTQRRAEQRPRGNRKFKREKRGDIRAIARET